MVDFSSLNVEGGDLDAVTFDFDGLDGIRLPLIGSYPAQECRPGHHGPAGAAGQGLGHARQCHPHRLEQVSWPGRFELLRHAPAFLLDGSHNAHGMRATVQSLQDRFPGRSSSFLLSIMADKDVDEMLALLLPLAEQFVTVAAHTPRGHARRNAGGAHPCPGRQGGSRQRTSQPGWPGRWSWAATARCAPWAPSDFPVTSGRHSPG